MIVRNAQVNDVTRIHELISGYAELDRMLFRSVSAIYETLQIFVVAEEAGQVVGCCALQVLWNDLAEIKSLAVDQNWSRRGIGRALVQACIDQARRLGLSRVFILTLEPDFFERVGFTKIQRDTLPMKVWSDCAACPKQDHCDEIAMEFCVQSA